MFLSRAVWSPSRCPDCGSAVLHMNSDVLHQSQSYYSCSLALGRGSGGWMELLSDFTASADIYHRGTWLSHQCLCSELALKIRLINIKATEAKVLTSLANEQFLIWCSSRPGNKGGRPSTEINQRQHLRCPNKTNRSTRARSRTLLT